MRITIISVLIFVTPVVCKAQSSHTVSSVCKEVSLQWKLGSTSCKGDRLKLVQLFQNARPDSISKNYLFNTLGKPNIIQRYSVGYPINKNYVQFIYYIYKDDCPEINVEGKAIGFVFDELETNFIRIEDHDYCG
ncbi:hypothetical protein ACFS6H_05705 [Terrimonas rubra]|uniref:Uncharacterized protein n=1 Tax=Terrimonas rubra TaxID=1035890 RepID=A0ABW6A3L1_9BACT